MGLKFVQVVYENIDCDLAEGFFSIHNFNKKYIFIEIMKKNPCVKSQSKIYVMIKRYLLKSGIKKSLC